MPRSRIPLLLPLALVASLAACNKPAASDPASAPPEAMSADAAATDTAPAAAQAQAASPDFVLDMDKVDAYYATIAKLSSMVAAAGDDAEDMDDVTAMSGSESVDQYIARIEADPKARALITSAGMSVSDYAHTNETLVAGMMTAAALESGALKTIPDGIDPQYVKFAQVHKTELAARLKALQAQYGGE